MDEAKKEIIDATYTALSKHSYTDLSIQNIADEFDKSKSLLYHHYNGKDEILLDSLDYMLERFEKETCIETENGIKERFNQKAYTIFRDIDDLKFLKTLVELRTHSLRDERYREKFQKFEKMYTRKLENLLKEGVKKNKFKDINITNASTFIIAVNNEAMFKKASEQETEGLKKELEQYIENRIYR